MLGFLQGGTAPARSLARLMEDARNDRVIGTCAVPVRIVPGHGLAPLDRIGIPAALAAVLALLVASAMD